MIQHRRAFVPGGTLLSTVLILARRAMLATAGSQRLLR